MSSPTSTPVRRAMASTSSIASCDQLSDSDSDVVIFAGDYVILKVLLGKYVTPGTVARHLKPLLAHAGACTRCCGNHDWWKNGAGCAMR